MQRHAGHIIMNTGEKELREIKDILQPLFLNYNRMCEQPAPLGVGCLHNKGFEQNKKSI